MQGRLSRVPFIHGGFGPSGGERFDDAAAYYEVTGAGEVVRKYGEPLPFSIEDEMTVSNIHRVIGDALYEFYWSQLFGHGPRVEARVLLRDLRPHEGPPPFDPAAAIEAFERANRRPAEADH